MKKLLVVGLMMSNFVFAQNTKSDSTKYDRSVEEDLAYAKSEQQKTKAEKKEKPLQWLFLSAYCASNVPLWQRRVTLSWASLGRTLGPGE